MKIFFFDSPIFLEIFVLWILMQCSVGKGKFPIWGRFINRIGERKKYWYSVVVVLETGF